MTCGDGAGSKERPHGWQKRLAVWSYSGVLLMTYEAILFDLDGVIIDTQQVVREFWEGIAQAHGVHLTQADFDQHIYGCPDTHTLEVLFPPLSADERRSILAKMTHVETNMTYTALDGVIELLALLRQRAIPTALVTSAYQWKVQEVLSQLNLDGIFTVQVTAEDIQKGKPHPECYLQAARKLRQPPGRCIVFEDAVSGVKAAVASGALCVGVQVPGKAAELLRAGACHVVSNFHQVALLEGQKKAQETWYVLQIGPESSLPIMTSGLT
jgi:HAD superfamily hydrolase (TIGR01509 family)